MRSKTMKTQNTKKVRRAQKAKERDGDQADQGKTSQAIAPGMDPPKGMTKTWTSCATQKEASTGARRENGNGARIQETQKRK
eukprot:12344223-Karenia_brevis.AAC.1